MVMKLNPVTGLLEDVEETDPIALANQSQSQTPSPVAQQPIVQPDVEENIVAPTPTTVNIKTTDISTTKPIIAPQETEALNKIQGNRAEEDRVLAEAEKFKLESAKIEADKALEAQKIKEAQLVEKEKREKELQLSISKADLERQQAKDEFVKNNQIKDYWQDKSTGDRVLVGFAIALGGLGAGMSGSNQNDALQVVQKNIDRDFQKQKENIQARKDALEQAGKLSQEARSDYNFQLAALDNKHAAAYETAIKKFDTLAASRGVKAQELDNNATRIGLQKSRDAFDLKAAESLRGAVTTKVTEEQKPVEVKRISPEVKQAQEELQSNEEFKTYKTRRQARDSFVALKNSGAEGAAVADFVAIGLKQGSFGPEMIKILEKRSLLSKGGELIRENWEGNYDPTLLADLEKGLKQSEAVAKSRATGPIQRARDLGKSLTGNSNYFLGEVDEGNADKNQNTNSSVPMLAPDGREMLVPSNRVKEMEAKGAKRK